MVYPMVPTSWSPPIRQMAPASIDPVTGAWNYSANPDFHGSDSFTVSVTDDQNHSATLASVTLTITSVDDATIITGDFNGTLLEDGNVTGDLNATDPDGYPMVLFWSPPIRQMAPHPSIRLPVPGTIPLIRIFTDLILSPYPLPTIRTSSASLVLGHPDHHLSG